MTTIRLIITSTRPTRIGGQVAEQLVPLLAESGARVEVTDLRELALPLLDEALPPAMGQYALPHTLQWKHLVDDADAIVWLTPEYNGGYTAAAKNAIDMLKAEWNGKPTLVVGYGFGGAARAVAQLTAILGNVATDLVETSVLLPFGENAPGKDGRLADPSALVGPHADEVRAAVEALLQKVDGDIEDSSAA